MRYMLGFRVALLAFSCIMLPATSRIPVAATKVGVALISTPIASPHLAKSSHIDMPSYMYEIGNFRKLWPKQKRTIVQSNVATIMTGPDIDVLYIERKPRYDFDAAKGWPSDGDTVTFTAHVKNSGASDTSTFAY